MMEILNNIHLALPELVILVTACVVLLSELFTKDKSGVIGLSLSLVGLTIAMLISFLYVDQFETLLFKGAYISDDMASVMKVFITLTVGLTFIYARPYLIERNIPCGEFYIIALFSTLGMMILVSGYSLLTLYMGLELLSLPLYALTAYRRQDANGAEAAVKYFVMGALASGMILYGMSLVYGATGQLDLRKIAEIIASQNGQDSLLLIFGMVLLIAGTGFKLASVPFHMWAPDVYQGAPAPVTLFISAAPKIAGLALLMRILTVSFALQTARWQPVLIAMSLMSIFIGNLLAIAQDNLKRLLAYSAISHTGYALMGIVAATPEGYAASLYYILVYALSSVAGFGLITILSKDGREIERVSDLKGLNTRNPWLAFLFMLVMFSMAGVPILVGFFTKLLVLKALVDANLLWFAVAGLFFAVIGAYYYLRIVKVMYFEEPEDSTPFVLSKPLTVVYSMNALALLILGIVPSALITLCTKVFI